MDGEGGPFPTSCPDEIIAEGVAQAGEALYIFIEDFVPSAAGGMSVAYGLLRQAYQLATDAMFRQHRQLLDVRVFLLPQDCPRTARVVRVRAAQFASPRPWEQRLHIGQFGTVAIGGTFDHLHAGHKLMLSVALMLARAGGRLVVGVTDDGEMTARKQHRPRLETFAQRSGQVVEFLRQFSPAVAAPTVEIAKLSDPFGPTVQDASIEALVVSPETLPGAQSSKRRASEAVDHPGASVY